MRTHLQKQNNAPVGWIHATKEGLDFYTRIADGVSGMSIRAVARAAGIQPSALRKVLNQVNTKQCPKWAQNLNAQLVLSGHQMAKIVLVPTVWKIISHYAMEGVEPAMHSVITFGQFGMESFIRAATGWSPETAPTTLAARLSRLERDVRGLKADRQRKSTAGGLPAPLQEALLHRCQDTGAITFQTAAEIIAGAGGLEPWISHQSEPLPQPLPAAARSALGKALSAFFMRDLQARRYRQGNQTGWILPSIPDQSHLN